MTLHATSNRTTVWERLYVWFCLIYSKTSEFLSPFDLQFLTKEICYRTTKKLYKTPNISSKRPSCTPPL